uniref:Uncharacterized protein n=1 Tax=Romanomermis culicivorax TaxID=13658 RepID=A0A915KJU4_ROMCU
MEYNHDLAYAFINPDSKANIPLEFVLNVEFKKNLFLDETVPLRVYMFHYFIGFVKDLENFYIKKDVHIKNMQISLNEYNVRRVDHSIKMASSGNNPYEIYVEKIYSNRRKIVLPILKGHKFDSFKIARRSKIAKSFASIEGMFFRMKFGPDRPSLVLENELLHFLSIEYQDLMRNKFVKRWKGGQQAFCQGILAHLKNSLNLEIIAQGKEYDFRMEIRQKFDMGENLSNFKKKDPIYFLLCFHDSKIELAAAKLSMPEDKIRPLKPLDGPIKIGYKALISFSSDDTKIHTIVSEKPLEVERPNNMIKLVNSILKSKDLLKDPDLLKDCEILLHDEIEKILPENQKFPLQEWKFLSRYLAGMFSNTNMQKLSLFRIETSTFPDSNGINFMIKNKETDINLIFSVNEQYIAKNEIEKIDNQVQAEKFLKNALSEKDTVIFHFFVYPKHTIDDYHSFDEEDSTDFLRVDIVAQTSSINELSVFDMKKITPFDMELMLNDHEIDKQTLSKMFDVMFNQNSDLIDTNADFKAFIDGLFHDLHNSVRDLYGIPRAYSKRQVTLLSGETPVTINFGLDAPFEEVGQTCESGHRMLVESKKVDEFKGQTFVNVVYNRNSNEKAISLLRTWIGPQEENLVVQQQPKSILALLWKINQLILQYAWNKCKNRLFKRSIQANGQCVYKSINEIEGKKASAFEIHASKLNDLGNYAMNGLLLRDILADLIHWDIGRLKKDAIFLGKSVILYYIIKDLMDNWHLVKNSTSAKVNVASDAAILCVEGVDLTAGVLEGLGLVAGVSAVTGPLAGITTAVLLIGANIYQSVEKVAKINDQIELSRSEKFVEGLLAFAHLNPEDKISKLLAKKAIMDAALDFLRGHKFVKNYIVQYGDDENNFIDLRTKIPLKKSRLSMDKKTNLFCQSAESTPENLFWKFWHKITGSFDDEAQKIFGYNCTNSLGVSISKNLDGVTFYQLGTGNDTIFGFSGNINVFNLSSGSKEIHGGKMDDIFLLNQWSIFGFVDAYEGYNLVDMSGFGKNGLLTMASYANVLYIYYDKHTTSYLKMKNINGITGRSEATDLLHLTCNHKVANLQGGKNSNSKDYIFINDESCDFQTRITLAGYTKILHQASRGTFNYLILPYSNTIIDFQGKTTSSQLFQFKQPFTDMQNFTYAVKSDELYFQLLNETSLSLTMNRSLLNQFQIIFADNVSMVINLAGYPIAYLRTIDSTNQILTKYSELTKKLQITLVVKRMNEQTITLNHGQYILGDENSHENFHFEEQTIYLDEKNLTSMEIPRLEKLFGKIDAISDFYEKQIGGGLSMKSFMRTLT